MTEIDAMQGLPHASVRLYLALRQLMDFATGFVGRRPLISWQGLSEHLYVEPHAGMKEGRYSVNQARRANGWLIRRGLVEMHSNAKQWHLIFKLPLAQRGFFAGKKADSKWTGKADRPLQSENNPQPDRDAQVEADKHQGTEYKYHHSTIDRVSPNSAPVDNFIVPSSLTPEQKIEVLTLIQHSTVSDQGQAILDELAGTIAKGAIRKTAAAFVVGCITRAKAGAFNLDKGKPVLAERLKRDAQSISDDSAPEPLPASRTASRAAIDASRAILKGGRA